jgi:PKD repeat protein
MYRATTRLVMVASLLLAVALPGIGAPRALAAPPTLSVPGAQTVPELQTLAFTVTATDPDGQLCDLFASNLPGGALFTDNRNNTGSFSWTPDAFAAGSYVAYFTADDTFGGRTTASVDVTVTNANGPPVLDPIADRSLEQGSMAFISVSGSDPDGDPLALTASGLPPFGTLTDNGDGSGSIQLMPSGTQPPGSWPVTVYLTDGTNAVSQSFTVTVTPPPGMNPPVLDPIGNKTVAEGSGSSVTVTASDPDGGGLTFTSSLPGFATFTPGANGNGSASATLAMNPGYCASGTYPATVAVSDGSLSDQESFNITVTDVSRPPVWASYSYAVSVGEGGSGTLDVAASDPDQTCGAAAPALSLVGSNAGSALTLGFTNHGDGTGRLTLTAGSTAAGSYTVTLRATDIANPSLAVETRVAVTVTNVNHAPVANAGGPYSGVTGSGVSMSGAASSDPDGDALTYAWTFGDGATGNGQSVSHAYAEAGTYSVTLTVSDASLAGTASTSTQVASASVPLAARAWCEPKMIRLWKGSPWVRVYLEPVNRSFDPASVVISSVTLATTRPEARVSPLKPLMERSLVVPDRNGNGVSEVQVEFSRDQAAELLSFLKAPAYVTFVVSAELSDGREVQASFTAEVIPEKKCAIRRVGPNPLNPEATVSVVVNQTGHVLLRVFDLRGRYVRTIYDGDGQAGQTLNVTFDGHDEGGRPLASGKYFLKAELAGEVDSSPITILK